MEAHGAEYDPLDRQMVYQTIVSHMVLRTVEQDRDVYDSLGGQVQSESLTGRERRRMENQTKKAQLNNRLLQFFPKLMLWFPAIVCLLLVLFNLASNTVLPSPFRPEPGIPVPANFDDWDCFMPFLRIVLVC